MRLPSTGCPRRSTTASSVGAARVFNKIFAALQRRAASRSVDDRCDLSEGASDGRQPLKKGLFPDVLSAPRRSELEAPRCLRWQGAPAHYAAERRADEGYKGAALMIDAFPKARSCSVTKATTPTSSEPPWASAEIIPCIPSKANRKCHPLRSRLYRPDTDREHVGRLKDWRRILPATIVAPTLSVSHLLR